MSIQDIALAWIVVADLKKAVKYYTQVVGLKLLEHNDEFGWAELAGENGGTRLGIAQQGGHCPMTAGNNAIVTLTVTDLVKAKNELTKKGAKLVGDMQEVPGHVKLQLFEDTDGNKLQLVEDLSKK